MKTARSLANFCATLPASAVTDLAGNAVVADSVIAFRVLRGDADGNGVVDFSDYSLIDHGFNLSLSGWSNGDFDGNGRVDFDDYSLIDFAFNTQAGMQRPATIGVKAPNRAPTGRLMLGHVTS